MLSEFVTLHRDAIITRCRAKAIARSISPATEAVVEHGVPVFLSQLVDALRRGLSTPEIGRSGVLHGHDLLMQGYSVSQVVHEYGDVCQAITELAVELSASISAEDFRTLNRCLDEAIAGAVTEYGRERNQSTLDTEVARGRERLGFLAHELRNLIHTALVSFDVLKKGNAGVAGSTAAVLHRSLKGLNALIGRALEEVRLTRKVDNQQQFLVSGLIDELAPAAALMARTRGIELTVMPVEDGIAVQADREILAAVVGNLLQNAFKFTRPRTTVTLEVGTSADRVLIEIQDECGGIPNADLAGLFNPFEQRNADRTGLGIGLAFCRWGVEANHGRIHVRTIPGSGCIFTVDLPRVTVPVEAIAGAEVSRPAVSDRPPLAVRR